MMATFTWHGRAIKKRHQWSIFVCGGVAFEHNCETIIILQYNAAAVNNCVAFLSLIMFEGIGQCVASAQKKRKSNGVFST